jgi:hypothetical protein
MLRRIADAIRRFLAPGWGPPEQHVFVVVLTLVAFGGTACSGSLETARAQPKLGASPATAERCEELDDRRTLYGGAAKAFGVLGGGAGLATVATDDESLQTGLAIGAAASAALAVGALYVAEGSGESWARECAAR